MLQSKSKYKSRSRNIKIKVERHGGKDRVRSLSVKCVSRLGGDF